MKEAIPSLISLVRVVVGFCIVIVGDLSGAVFSLSVLIAGASDILDGKLARKLGVVTAFGSVWDPIADRVFFYSVVHMLYNTCKISIVGVLLFTLRDVSLFLHCVLWYAFKLCSRPRWKAFPIGKVLTSYQFLIIVLYFSCVCKPCFELIHLLLNIFLIRSVFASEGP